MAGIIPYHELADGHFVNLRCHVSREVTKHAGGIFKTQPGFKCKMVLLLRFIDKNSYFKILLVKLDSIFVMH